MSTLDYFWSIWERDYLLLLRQRSMVHMHRQHGTVNTVPHIGDIVIVQDSDQPRANWKVGCITEVIHSRDDLICSARILMPTKRIITRPLSHLYPLEVSCTQPPDTPVHLLRQPLLPVDQLVLLHRKLNNDWQTCFRVSFSDTGRF